MERKQVRFTKSQIDAIRRAARRQRTSDAAIVREAVDRLLVVRQWTPPNADQIERALASVGRFASGRSDVSQNHDRELTER